MITLATKLLFIAVALILSAASLEAQELSALSTMLASPSGDHVSVSDIGKGKVTVVTFWLTSCTPSKRQLDAMVPLVDQLGDSVQFIAIAIDNAKSIARVGPLVKSKGYRMTVLLDPNQDLFSLVNGSEHPYTLVFGKDGRLASKHVGFFAGDEDRLSAEILALTTATVDHE